MAKADNIQDPSALIDRVTGNFHQHLDTVQSHIDELAPLITLGQPL